MKELIITFIIILMLFFIYIIIDNKFPRVSSYDFYINKDNKINEKDNAKKYKKEIIYQISDLHNSRFGDSQKRIINKIINPNYIFITGDLINRNSDNIDNAKLLIENLSKNYNDKIYFTTGNHEKGSRGYTELKNCLIKNNIRIMSNENIVFKDFNLIGLEDPSEYISLNKLKNKDYKKEVEKNLINLVDNNKFNLLLSHRPEFMDIYSDCNVDLILSGHVHGGQIRLFGRGLIAPGQGLLPKYHGGLVKEKKSNMIISRGLGNNFWFIKRIFNSPEIVKINLYFDI